MLTPLTKLKQMSSKQLHNALMQDYPDDAMLREQIKASIRKEKRDKRVAKIKHTQQIKAWAPLIYQAYRAVLTPKARVQKAMALYGSSMGYGSPYEAQFDESPSKRALDTYKAYAALLHKVLDKLRSYRDAGTHTPKQLAKEKGIPNEGEHWSDWIPEDIKRKFIRSIKLLEDTPPFIPFQRSFYKPPETRPRKTNKAKPERVLSTIEQLGKAIKEALVIDAGNSTPETRAKIVALIQEQEQAKKEKQLEYSRRHQAKLRAERQAKKEARGDE